MCMSKKQQVPGHFTEMLRCSLLINNIRLSDGSLKLNTNRGDSDTNAEADCNNI